VSESVEERRRYRRVRAPILVRPTGPLAAWNARPPVGDISGGGLRAYADEAQTIGTRLSLDLLFPQGEPAHVLAEVVWVQELPEGSPARFDVGLRFLQIAPADLQRIEAAADG
jgi:hypothetical protein